MKSIRWRYGLVLLVLCAFLPSMAAAAERPRATQNVIFVMTDGLRWQEVFRGASQPLLRTCGSLAAPLEQDFWRESPELRRQALLPFLWSVVAKRGQLYGNRDKGSVARLTNGLKFSYPGYQEILCGYTDPHIASNGAPANPNVTVLEWLHHKPAYRGRVAAFAAWDAFNRIFNSKRCGFPVNAGSMPLDNPTASPRIDLLNRLKGEITWPWADEPADAVTFYTALEYFKTARPRVFYLSLGETDEWAHAGRYDAYLRAAHRADDYLRTLWETAQSIPQYRGTTTLIFSTDHGRGEGQSDWRNHGQKVKGAEYIWLGFLGPDTPPLGEHTGIEEVTQSQVAATLAALLGEDYAAAVPKAARPISAVLGQ